MDREKKELMHEGDFCCVLSRDGLGFHLCESGRRAPEPGGHLAELRAVGAVANGASEWLPWFSVELQFEPRKFTYPPMPILCFFS